MSGDPYRPRRVRRVFATLAAVAAVAIVGLVIGVGGSLAGSAARPHSNAAGRAGVGVTDVPSLRDSRERFDFVNDHNAWPLLPSRGTDVVFPAQEVFLTVPRRASLAASQVHVFENGQPVTGVNVTPLGSGVPVASPATLGTGYTGQAASKFVVSYTSQQRFGTREVELGIHVDGVGYADLDYDAPRVAPALVVLHPDTKNFWDSTRSMLAIAAGSALLIALALFALIAPRRRRAGLRKRIGEFISQTPEVLPTDTYDDVPARPRFAAVERLISGARWWAPFKEKVEIAGFDHTAIELVVIDLTVTVIGAILLALATGLIPIALLVLPFGLLALRSIVNKRLDKQRRLFADQLAPHLEELSSTMRAGHGLVSGLTAMTRTAAEPSQREWARVLSDEQIGMPLEIAMQSLARRMDCDEIEQVALVASLHSRTGGNMAEVLDRVADGVRERAELRRELFAMTSQARLSRWVVVAIPPVLVGVIELIDPKYMKPLFTTTLGIVLLIVAIGLVTTGSLVMKAMTETKV